MTAEERQQVLQIVLAHERTMAVCRLCAETTRDLAAEVKRGGIPSRDDLAQTITEAEDALNDLARVREEVDRLKRAFAR
jgi:hypothetical protein